MTDHSVFLIGARRLFREGLRQIFSNSSFAVVHETSSIEDALPFVQLLQPSLMLVDLPNGGEIPSAQMDQLRAAAPLVRIVILTAAIVGHRLADALSAGVDGYLQDNMSAEALHQSLGLVLLGEKVFPTDLADLLINGQRRRDNGPLDNFSGLSEGEMQILRCLINGAPNKEIAHRLEISSDTVKMRLKSLLKKIGVQNRTQAAIWAMNHRLALGISAMQHVS